MSAAPTANQIVGGIDAQLSALKSQIPARLGSQGLRRAVAAEPAPEKADDQDQVAEVGEDAHLRADPPDQHELEVENQGADEKDLAVAAVRRSRTALAQSALPPSLSPR